MYKKVKYLISLLICVSLSITSVCASSFPSQKENTSDLKSNIIWHDINELDKLTRDDVFTYDELLSHLINNGYTYTEAINIVGTRPTETYSNRSTEIYYSTFKMDNFVYSRTMDLTSYRFIVQARFVVGLEYIDGDITPNRIVSISDAHLYTGAGDPCSFRGTMSYRLQNGRSFYYTFYGDLYLRGQVNWSVSATINIGGSASVTATISNSDGYITNISESESYSSSALNP